MLDLIGAFKSVQAKKARTNSHLLKAGFTLIELSIVLVIIGLLIGGIMTGQDLIKSAQLRSLVSEGEKYKLAITNFQIKYNCTAGDCAYAASLFKLLTSR